jgi:hypothetical protein
MGVASLAEWAIPFPPKGIPLAEGQRAHFLRAIAPFSLSIAHSIRPIAHFARPIAHFFWAIALFVRPIALFL